MPIENFKEASAGKKYPRRPEWPKNHTEKLKRMLENISAHINQETQQYGISGFLNPDCTIDMDGYSDRQDGIYPDVDVQKHKEKINSMELEFSSANIPAVQEFHYSEYGIQTPEGIVRRWKEGKEKNKNGQTEMAITALLHKILKNDFLVVRTATYDDYRHGVDNIILNKRTGEVICAFDEVHEGGRGERTSAKKEKVKKAAERGGTEISYGVSLKDGKFARASMKNVPVFFLSLQTEELMNLLNNMNFDLEAAATPVELEIFSKLAASLRQQQRDLLNSAKVPPVVRQKLAALDNSLAVLERIGSTVH